MIRLFVYGSLMKQAASHEVIKGCRFITPAYIKDYCLYDLGVEMAAIVSCDNPRGVYGEVYELTEEKLEDVDNFSGYLSGNKPNSLFERIHTTVETLKKETLEVDTYILPESRLSQFSIDLITQGRWV